MAANTYLKAVISATDKLSPVLKGINRAMRSTKKAVSEIGNAGAQLRSTMTGVVAPLGAVVGLGAAASFGGLVGKVVQTSAQFEKFQTILETVEGSSEKARASMNWVSDFATKTPYELQEVTDSFVKLKAYGIDPQAGALKAAGDAAAAMGKPLEQAVEALADAMTGENERLKEFGIKASKAGDQIVYTWTENGKTMAAKVSASNKAMIQSTLQGIWNRRYGGAMDKLSGTWDGMLSNLKDGVARFMLSIGDAGLFGFLKNELGGLLAKLNTMADDGSLKALATTISNELVTAFKELKAWAESVDWKGVWQDVKDVASGIKTLIESIGGFKGVAIAFGAVLAVNIISPLYMIVGALGRLGLSLVASVGGWSAIGGAIMGVGRAIVIVGRLFLMNPIGLAISAIIGAGWLLYENWETIKGWFVDFFNWLPNKISEVAGWLKSLVPDWLKGGSVNVTMKQVSDVGGDPGLPAAQRPSVLQQMRVQNQRTNIQGEMVMRFENAPPGLRVSQGKTNLPGLAMNPDVGYSSNSLVGAY
jgi:hypothetical protein